MNPDEWIGLEPGHSESYLAYLQRELPFDTNIAVPDGTAEDPVGAAAELERLIVAAGGFDYMVCGMGINGHIGFFEPAPAGLSSQAEKLSAAIC